MGYDGNEGKGLAICRILVVGCAIEIHKTLGPGLLESTYQQCLAHELSIKQIEFRIENPLPVI